MTGEVDAAGDPRVAAVRGWLREQVVGLGLCPYAAGPLAAGRVRIAVVPGDVEARLAGLYLEAERLVEADPAGLETTLVLVPDAPVSFEDFLDETDLGAHLVEQAVGDALQVVAFHPGFRFEASDLDDPANGVNRSPLALWHLIRQASIDRVVAADPDAVAAVPGRNQDLLRRLVAGIGEV
jgi:hypothetical protein